MQKKTHVHLTEMQVHDSPAAKRAARGGGARCPPLAWRVANPAPASGSGARAAFSVCEVLSKEMSLELLLRAGGCEQMLDAPPPAALKAVEICGRLPLALSLAGGIIEELADSWEEELVPLQRRQTRIDAP